MTDGRARLRHVLITLALVAGGWSAILLLTSGVSFSLGPLHVSSRNARNPALAALLLGALAAMAAPPGARLAALRGDVLPWVNILIDALLHRTSAAGRRTLALLDRPLQPPFPVVLAAAMAVSMLVLFWQRGVFVAGGADAYGYVSEANLFATGRLVQPQPLLRKFPHILPDALSPLGYRPASDRDVLLPIYSPGLPLTMAGLQVVAGSDAVYLVMPVLAALTVWFTYRIGEGLVGPGTGLGAAVLMATSPAMLLQMVYPPMSDIPAMGWWTISLAMVLRRRQRWWTQAIAGIAAGAAILTRPNLVLLGGVVGGYLLWLIARPAAGRSRAEEWRRLAWFCAGVIPACAIEGWLNAQWFGSPLNSGYGAGLSVFHLSNWQANVINYPRWLNESQTPLLLFGLAAPFLISLTAAHHADRRVSQSVFLATFAGIVFFSYVFYEPFGVWWYLRFLLPAYPALAVLTAATLASLATRFSLPARLTAITVVLFAAAYSVHFLGTGTGVGDYRYRIIAEYVRDRLPPQAVLFTMQHSGSMKMYSGREIVRYDILDNLDLALQDLRAAGYHPFVVIDEWEADLYRERIGNRSTRGSLDWPPIAILPLANVTIWDLGEDPDVARASGRKPETIPVPDFVRRRLP